MRTRDLVARISKRVGTGITQQDVRKIIDALVLESKDILHTGEEIRFRGLCKFYIARSRGKYRLKIEAFPAFNDEIETRFVENKENLV